MALADPIQAQVFRRLHEKGLLILPNAWDAGSARLIESLGARAIATTSAGVAWSHGYADGNQLPVRLVTATVSAIARVVSVPVTADIEGGYSDDPSAVAETVARVIDAGAVGINLEDGTGDPALLCAKIESARGAARGLGADLFINARTDVYLRGLVPASRRVEETLARAQRYRAAGADGIFVPALTQAAEIRAITSAVPLPVNVIPAPGLPTASELEALGVARLSAGADIAETVFGSIRRLAAAFLESGASDPPSQGAMPYAEINALFPKT